MNVFIFLILGILIVIELSTYIVYGGYLNKEEGSKYLYLDRDKMYLNMFSSSIIMIEGSSKSINTLPFTFTAKYYISGEGIVPRWSKLHRRINEYYKIVK